MRNTSTFVEDKLRNNESTVGIVNMSAGLPIDPRENEFHKVEKFIIPPAN